MARLLEFALLSFIAWMVWTQVIQEWRSPSSAPRDPRLQAPPPPPPPSSSSAANAGAAQQPALTLVPCSSCGVHVPSSRTLPGPAGEVYCSAACRGRGASRRPA